MNCPNCSHPIAPGVQICTNCRFNIAQASPQVAGTENNLPSTAPNTTSNQTQSLDFTVKLLKPKYLLIIIAIEICYLVLRALPGLLLIIVIVFIVYTFVTVSKIKKNPSVGATETEKNKAVILMTFDPVIAQAIYYYRLRNVDSKAAHAYNQLGWRVLGLDILIYVAILALLLLITGE